MKDLSLSEIEALLPVDKHRLDDALEEQGAIAGMISRLMVAAEIIRDEAADALKRKEAALTLECKGRDEKMALDVIKANVTTHPDRRDRFESLQKAEERFKRWTHMRDDWKARGFTIRDLGMLYSGDYFSAVSSIRGPDAREASRLADRQALRAAASSREAQRSEREEPLRRRTRE